VGDLSALYEAAEARAAEQAEAVEQTIRSAPPLSPEALAGIKKRVQALQERVGYTSDYDAWIAAVIPPDME
jgi:hypothetical protein